MENITWGYICNSGPIHFYIPLENIIQSDGYIALTIPFEEESAIRVKYNLPSANDSDSDENVDDGSDDEKFLSDLFSSKEVSEEQAEEWKKAKAHDLMVKMVRQWIRKDRREDSQDAWVRRSSAGMRH